MAEPTNAEQVEYWNAQAGPRWVELEARIDGMLRPIGHRAMERARPAAGERVLDVGCGCGESTLELARRVAPHGRAVGLDVSAPMLARASARARAARAGNVEFVRADAQTHAFEPPGFDLVFSRFGVMFFDAPEQAFANLRAALRPGGRLAFVCWRRAEENPWMTVPMRVVRERVELPPPPAPGAPGPFAFADAERVAKILEAAGFRAAELAPLDATLALGGPAGGAGDAADFALSLGQAGAALREAGADVDVARAAVARALAPFSTPSGVVMPYAAWIVSALA